LAQLAYCVVITATAFDHRDVLCNAAAVEASQALNIGWMRALRNNQIGLAAALGRPELRGHRKSEIVAVFGRRSEFSNLGVQ
jgi:hypothetical protein